MEGSCEYTELVDVESRQGVVVRLVGLGVGPTTCHSKKN